MRRRSDSAREALSCSFCHKSQDTVGKLISSPSDYPRAYICDECIRVCAAILEDDAAPSSPDASDVEPEPEDIHPLLSHPLASRFMASVERWLTRESLGLDAAEEFGEMRSLASRMLRAAK